MSHQQFHHYHHQHQHQHQQLQQVQSESQLERSLESERNQQNQRSANSNANTERVSGLGSMDFRNLCQRLDVNGLRAKLPSLPSLPPLKLPKSLPKLRGRKIFRSSRRNNNSKDAAGAAGAAATAKGGCSLTLPQQSQQFINRTPQRISTISSLMYEEEQEMGTGMGMGMGRGQPSTYRSAGSLDDDYYAPESGHGERHSRPISPVKIPSPPAPAAAAAAGGPTLTQRLQRGYKSLSELRLKHLFAKQTTLRRDNIEVDRYVEQYEAELRSEQRAQARRDREIADNYDIRFKTLARSRQNTPDSDKQPPKPRSVAEQSGDESGMEETPPPLPTRSRKKPGIAATRFAKVRQPPLQMDEEEEETEAEAERQKRVEEKEAPPRRSSCKQLLQKLPSFPNSLPSLQRRSRGNEERAQRGEETPTQKSAIRQNIKRLRKSIKRPAKLKQKQPQKPADDSDEDQGQGQGQGQQQEEKKEPPVAKSTGNLRARLSRFASTEQLQERWRKSFKTAAQDSQESPKQAGAGAGAGAGAAAGAATGMAIGVHLERTLTKLNEKMHQLKFFQRQGAAASTSTSACSAEAQPKPNTVGHEPVYIDDDEELAATYHHSDSDEDEDEDEEERGSQDSGQDVRAEEAFGQQEEEDDAEEEADSEEETQMEHPLSGASSAHAARQMATLAELQAATASAALAEESCPRGGRSFTAWSSESLEEIPDEDYPRVLIHQQHTDDSCESTLIIAVSTKPSSPAPPTPGQWLPNAEIISSFKEQQQQQQQPKEAESWPGPRSLYKPKSIDIFEGASGAAFADFDEALRNAPILRISAGSSCDTSGDEEADDSSSRVTRIRMQTDPPPQIGNSRESLMAQELEEEEEEEEDEEEEDSAKEDSDECALERPPSASPPPPPLPQRRPLQRKTSPPTQAAPIYDAVPPPLPTSKPPPLSMTPAAAAVLPQRSSASMSRPAKPLVKTSSLRLTYNEQVHPGDIGKVNKLISRFEGGRRPRLCPRRLHSEEYELHATSSSFSGEEEEEQEEQDDDDAEEDEAASPITPTNRPVVVIPEIVTTQPSISNNNNNNNGRRKAESLSLSLDQSLDRQNSNCSRSEYGSPLSYPYASQRRSSTPTGAPLAPPSSSQLSTPHQQMLQQQQQQRQQARRSRRSMTRDDENFYSFDSDEENSYYSISPSGSSRYVVEI